MAATQTVPELLPNIKSPTSITPRHGTLTSFGYGTRIYVERGHLTIEDGIGADRRKARLPKVGHGLRRLVAIGSDGFVSLAALRWLADQGASFVMLDRDGAVLLTTGPVRPSDARLRRAQSLAHQSGLALQIASELIYRKLLGQANLARAKLNNSSVADAIAETADTVKSATSIEMVRQLEARAAQVYWLSWRDVPISFPRGDSNHIPDHWRTFGTRKSPLTGSQRLAVNPPNAMLNYLYAILESESRLALATLGLDPGIGVLHVDTPSRDSFACDLMEAIRPQVDAYVLDWITRHQLRRNWFFEQRNGNCRLLNSFAVQLSDTAQAWGRAVGPIAEWISRTLWSNLRKPTRQLFPATRLTQDSRRKAKGRPTQTEKAPPTPPRLCVRCGKPVNYGKTNCASCGKEVSRENLIEVAKLGRLATHSAKAEALRSATQRRQAAALKTWNESGGAMKLTQKNYSESILPGLKGLTVPSISAALGISKPYATDIRSGRKIPHPRHWSELARFAGIPLTV